MLIWYRNIVTFSNSLCKSVTGIWSILPLLSQVVFLAPRPWGCGSGLFSFLKWLVLIFVFEELYANTAADTIPLVLGVMKRHWRSFLCRMAPPWYLLVLVALVGAQKAQEVSMDSTTTFFVAYNFFIMSNYFFAQGATRALPMISNVACTKQMGCPDEYSCVMTPGDGSACCPLDQVHAPYYRSGHTIANHWTYSLKPRRRPCGHLGVQLQYSLKGSGAKGRSYTAASLGPSFILIGPWANLIVGSSTCVLFTLTFP